MGLILSVDAGFAASFLVDLHDLLKHLLLDALLQVDVVVQLSHLCLEGVDNFLVLVGFLFHRVLVEVLEFFDFEVEYGLDVVVVDPVLDGCLHVCILVFQLGDEAVLLGDLLTILSFVLVEFFDDILVLELCLVQLLR